VNVRVVVWTLVAVVGVVDVLNHQALLAGVEVAGYPRWPPPTMRSPVEIDTAAECVGFTTE
jgi:hypothetical protein